MAHAQVQTSLALLNGLNTVFTTRFAAGSALTLSLWDILITMNDEIEHIWPLPLFSPTKALFFFVRYGNLGSLIYANYMYGGLHKPSTDMECKAFQATVKRILCIALAIVHIPVFILGGISVYDFTNNTTLVPYPISSCVTVKEAIHFKIAFGCVLVYDVFVIFLAMCNALDCPRGPQHPLVANLVRDGTLFFAMLFLMRLANFLFFLFLPISQVFCVIFLTWAVISLTLSRMIIRIESSKAPFANMYTSDVRFKTWVAARNTFDFEQASWAAGSIGGSISS